MREALAAWADQQAIQNPTVQRVGCFGSYAHGDWGVGSDLDVVVLVSRADRPFIERPSTFDPHDLPVPTDVLVYTQEEWTRMQAEQRGPARDPIVWVWPPSD